MCELVNGQGGAGSHGPPEEMDGDRYRPGSAPALLHVLREPNLPLEDCGLPEPVPAFQRDPLPRRPLPGKVVKPANQLYHASACASLPL